MNYSQTYAKLTGGLSEKVKDILDRRFGVKKLSLKKGGKNQELQMETLESIGKRLGITRERVRQIEEAGFKAIRKNKKEILESHFAGFENYFEKHGGFKKEDEIMADFGGVKNRPYVLFLLTIRGKFFRECEKKDHYGFWSVDKNKVAEVKNTLGSLASGIQGRGTLLAKEEMFNHFASQNNLTGNVLSSYLEISKKIQTNREGEFGLAHWPEVNPRGVKDKAFLVFKKAQKPLHFREIASLIDQLGYDKNKKAHPQTVHNELIKDPKFVLVGRGTYALKEWGYAEGTVKDIIANVLKNKPHLASQSEIVAEVLSQRTVAKNTVLINLNNRKYFYKDSQGRYLPRETA